MHTDTVSLWVRSSSVSCLPHRVATNCQLRHSCARMARARVFTVEKSRPSRSVGRNLAHSHTRTLISPCVSLVRSSPGRLHVDSGLSRGATCLLIGKSEFGVEDTAREGAVSANALNAVLPQPTSRLCSERAYYDWRSVSFFFPMFCHRAMLGCFRLLCILQTF